jgi:membrane protein DedA with SNARE-associated domain
MEAFLTEHVAILPIVVWLLLMASAIGIPVGEDVVNIAAGIVIGKSGLPPEVWLPTLIAAWFGVTTADIIWFMLCHRFGSKLLRKRRVRRVLHPRRLLQVKHQIDRRGVWAIVGARFVPGGRTPMITVAGLLHLKPWKFCLATWSCVLITAPMQLGFGVLIGRGIASRDGFAKLEWAIASVVLVVAGVLLWVMVRRLRRDGTPRARMRWLRSARQSKGNTDPA